MLLDADEVRIMRGATQPYLCVSQAQSDEKAKQIFDDFFAPLNLTGAKILELGPGQCDFARYASAAGANITIMDNDRAVVALARKRGYESILTDLVTFDWSTLKGQFDGLYARKSMSPHWFGDEYQPTRTVIPQPVNLPAFFDIVCAALKPGGWGFILPWNKCVEATRSIIELMLTIQRRALEQQGFTAFDLKPMIASLGIDPQIDNDELFLRGLQPPAGGLDVRRIVG